MKYMNMEKITIKINHVALQELCFALEIPHYPGTPEQKAVVSIMAELSKKLEKKEIDKRHTTKKFKMAFNYYEGFALERFCRDLYFGFTESNYLAHVALDIANQIHKQL